MKQIFFLMCLYKNELVDDILKMIGGNDTMGVLKYNCVIICMEVKQK